MTKYKHTQFGVLNTLVFGFVGVLIALVLRSKLADGQWLAAVILISIYLLGIALFYAFTVDISPRYLKFWFGVGWIRKSYILEEIQSSQAVVSPWYYFWGIKSIPGGWLYAIAPGRAVEIVLRNGKKLRLGTNQPKELKEALDGAKKLSKEDVSDQVDVDTPSASSDKTYYQFYSVVCLGSETM